jgi:hypothetical protein
MATFKTRLLDAIEDLPQIKCGILYGKEGVTYLKIGYSKKAFEEFIGRVDYICSPWEFVLHGVLWLEDGSWLETEEDGSWRHLWAPTIPNNCLES